MTFLNKSCRPDSKSTSISQKDDRPLGRGVERQSLLGLALCSNLPRGRGNIFLLRQLALVLLAILKALAPLGARVSVIALLPERLLGLIEGSL